MKSKFFNRAVAAILGACIVFACTGCGNDTATSENSDAVKITWLLRMSKPKEVEPVLEEVNKILGERIGVNLELEFIDSGAYTEKLNTYMASSKPYDLAFAGAGNPLVNAASKGGILSLDELLQKVPDLKESIPDYAWELVKYDNKIYGVPNLQVMPTALAVLLRTELLDKYGYKPEDFHSIDDLEPFLAKVKAGEPEDMYPFSPSRNSEVLEAISYCDDYAKADNVYFKQDADGTWKGTYKYETPEYRKQAEKMYDYYSKGYIRKDIVSAEGSTVGKGAACTFSVYKPGLETEYKAQGFDLKVQLISKPVISKCQALTVVGKDSKNPEKAMEVLREINLDKKLFNLISFGIEGKNYEMVGENTYRYLGDKSTNTYWLNAPWLFGNQFNAYVKEGADPDVWEQTEKYNEEAELSPFVGFAIDDKQIRTELSQLETVISRYSVINVGAENPANYYDEFLSELKKAGSEKVAAEYERQINEFMANKNK